MKEEYKMSISQEEYQRRYVAIREQMDRDELDCLLVIGRSDDFNRGNLRYVTGSGNGGICIFPLEGNPVFFIRPFQKKSPKLRKTIGAFDLLDLRERSNPEEHAIKELSRCYKGNRIGIVGMACISVSMYLAVTDKFKDRIIESTQLFDKLTVIKSAEEIENIRVASAIADKVYALLRDIVLPGVSEYEIYGAAKKLIYEMGCEYSFELIDGQGAMMNMSFFPTTDELEENGTLFFEITPAYDGYYAQLPVTLPVVEYPPNIYRMVETWAKSDKAAFETLRPGIKASELYFTLINTVQEKGFISPLEAGHDLGLNAHGPISVTADDNTILAPGMLMAIHASVMKEVCGDGVGMGYTYLITETGAERLSKVDLAKELLKR